MSNTPIIDKVIEELKAEGIEVINNKVNLKKYGVI